MKTYNQSTSALVKIANMIHCTPAVRAVTLRTFLLVCLKGRLVLYCQVLDLIGTLEKLPLKHLVVFVCDGQHLGLAIWLQINIKL